MNAPGPVDILTRLEAVIRERREHSPDQSYVARLHQRGLPVMARKLGEEGVEAAIAALSGSDEELLGEGADLLFHLLVLLDARGLNLAGICAELERREGVSGLDEKAARSEAASQGSA